MSCRVHMIKIKNIIKFDNLASENVEYKMMLSSMSSMTFHHELMGFEFLVAILNEWLLIKFDVNFIAWKCFFYAREMKFPRFYIE